MDKKKKIICGIVVVCVIVFASIYLIHERTTLQIKDKAFASDDNKVNTNTGNLAGSQNNNANSTDNTSSALQNNSKNTKENTTSGSNNNQTGNVSNSTGSNSSNASNSIAAANTGNAASSQNNTNVKGYEAYFGEWKIVKSIGTMPVYAMSKEDINSYIGKKVTLSKSQFRDTNGAVQSPRYEEKTISDSDFFDENRRQLSYIGVTGNSIKKLVISSPNGNIYNQIYLLDNKHMVYLWDGVFFQLEK